MRLCYMLISTWDVFLQALQWERTSPWGGENSNLLQWAGGPWGGGNSSLFYTCLLTFLAKLAVFLQFAKNHDIS